MIRDLVPDPHGRPGDAGNGAGATGKHPGVPDQRIASGTEAQNAARSYTTQILKQKHWNSLRRFRGPVGDFDSDSRKKKQKRLRRNEHYTRNAASRKATLKHRPIKARAKNLRKIKQKSRTSAEQLNRNHRTQNNRHDIFCAGCDCNIVLYHRD